MLNKIVNLCGAILLGLAAAFSAPAHATNTAMLDLLELLRNKGSITAQEYELLRNAALADEEKTNETKTLVEKQAEDLPRINTKGKLEIKSADGKHKFRIGGRLQHDITLVDSDGTYQGESEHQFRRARLYLSGTAAELWDFKFQYDFEDLDDNGQGIEAAYVKYNGWPVHITAGQRKAPYSMMEFTSSKYIAFIERSIASSLFNAASIGVGNQAPGITLTWDDQKNSGFLLEGGYYLLRQTDEDGDITERKIDDGNGISARAVWGRYDREARTLVSAGISGGYRNYANGIVGRFGVRPGVSAGNRIVDSNRALDADDYTSYNLNAAFMHRNFWASGEYYDGSFDLDGPGDDDMQGFYLQAGLFLSQEDSRSYKNGSWDSVKPRDPVGNGGIGAWEVALRYDSVELGDGLTSGTDEEGETFGIALNWYPIDNIRLQANYITTYCGSFGSSSQCAWGDAEPDFLVFRSQIFF